jgi:DNA-binding NarL/FixJ family response regulator
LNRTSKEAASVTVLIVDDSMAFRERVRRMLSACPDIELAGEAADGAAALADIERLRPDAVLLDLHMRGTDGFGVLRELKARSDRTPVIVLTSDATASVRERCGALGAHAVIDKQHAADRVAPALRLLASGRL